MSMKLLLCRCTNRKMLYECVWRELVNTNMFDFLRLHQFNIFFDYGSATI